MTTSGQEAFPQQRTVRTLMVSQSLAGIGAAIVITTAAVASEQLSRNPNLAGLGQTAVIVGTTASTIPVAFAANKFGRRPVLTACYSTAAFGALLAAAAASLQIWWLLIMGLLALGAGAAGSLAARFAAADRASSDRRARDISMVVWATAVGSFIGPQFVQPMRIVAANVEVSALAGPFALCALLYSSAAMWLHRVLRPEPLARPDAASGEKLRPFHFFETGAKVLRLKREARIAIVIACLGHALMIVTMTLAPTYYGHHSSYSQVGWIMSAHLAGMYIFSPLVGRAVDRWGAHAVALLGFAVSGLGSLIMVVGDSATHLSGVLGLMLIGLAWSMTLLSSSSMVAKSVDVSEKTSVQGLVDFSMNLCGALASFLGGLMSGLFGYLPVVAGAAALALVTCLTLAAPIHRRRTVA